MKSIIFFSLIVIASFDSLAQRTNVTDIDLMDAGQKLEKFAKLQSTATGFYLVGGGITLIGVLGSNSSSTNGNNGLLILGPIATGVGWIIDRSSHKHLKESGLFLQGLASNGPGLTVGYRF